jgi:tetratricopeptide (TPR) repeat protein
MPVSNFTWNKKAAAKRNAASAFDRDGQEDEGQYVAAHRQPAPGPVLRLEDPEGRFKRLKAEGIALVGSEKFWQAIHLWNQALEIHCDDAAILDMKCQSLIALHEWDPAIEVGLQGVKAKPNWHAALQTLGRAHAGRGNVSEARNCFQKAVHLQPDDRELFEEDLLWSQGLYLHRKAEEEAEKLQITVEASESVVHSK